MKNFYITFVFLFFHYVAVSQIQHGVVKTRGRLQDDGTCKSGVRIPDVLVSIKDGNTYMTDADGEFSFVSSNEFGNYSISSVEKKGYQLTDLDIILQDRDISEAPLYILMESDEDLMSYRRNIERKIRTNYQNKIYSMQQELENLRKEGTASYEELQRRQGEIDEIWSRAEQYVREMSEKYLRIDYDFNNDFDSKIGFYILNGELDKADSMLVIKGNLVERVREGVSYKGKIDRFNDETLRLCDYKIDIFKQRNLSDSVAFYLKLKTEISPECIEFQLDAAKYMAFAIRDYAKCLGMLDSLIYKCEASEALSYNLSKVFCTKGDIYFSYSDYDKAMSCYESAMSQYLLQHNELDKLDVFKRKGFVPFGKWNKNRIDLIPIYTGMAKCLAWLHVRNKGYNGKYKTSANYASDLYWMAIYICKEAYGEKHIETIRAYYEQASWYCLLSDYSYVKKICNRSVSILAESCSDSTLLANFYHMMGYVQMNKKQYKSSVDYTQKALDIYSEYDDIDNRQNVLSALVQFGKIYSDWKNYDPSIDYYLSAQDVGIALYGENSTALTDLYLDLASVYKLAGDIDKPIFYYNKLIENYLSSISYIKSAFGENSIDLATPYNNLGYIYSLIGDKEKSLYYLQMSYDLRLMHLGKDHTYTRGTKYNISYVRRNVHE